MAPTLLFELDGLDLDTVQYDTPAVEAVLPHRGHMRQLDEVVWMSPDMMQALGRKFVTDDEFWVDGHIPGRPLFPGVLMIETAAQLASFVSLHRLGDGRFFGFLGAENVRFRGQVVPGDVMLFLVNEVKFSRRRFVCDCQGIVDGKIVFEATLTGAAI